MKKAITIAVFIAAVCSMSLAQGGIGTTIRSYTAMPSTCTAGTDVLAGTVVLVNNILYSCYTNNNFRQASGPFSANTCAAASASGSAYTCSTVPSFIPGVGELMLFTADVANIGPATLNVNSAGAKPIKKQGGVTALLAGDFRTNDSMLLLYDGVNWQMIGQVANAPGSSILGPNPWYDMAANGAKGDGSSDNSAALNSVAAAVNASAGGNTAWFPPNASNGYFFNTKPANFASGINVKCPGNRGASFGYGSILSPNYVAGSVTEGFLTWNGSSGAAAGDGGGLDGCLIFKNSGTSGSAISITGIDSSNRAGHITISNSRISGSGTFARGLNVDGSMATGVGSQGVRDIFVNGLEIFQSTTDAIKLNNAAHFFAVNMITSPTAGNADINVTGSAGSTSSTQAALFANTEVGGNTNLDFANNVVFHGLTIGNYTVTNNTTNSSYFGNVNGNVTSTSSSSSHSIFGIVGGTITDTSKKLTYFTNIGAQLAGGNMTVVNGAVCAGTILGIPSVIAGDLCTILGQYSGRIFFGYQGTEMIAMGQQGMFKFLSGTTVGIQLGGNTASFPMIKQNGAAINFRLADDTGDASITANNVKAVTISGASNCASSASPAVCGSAISGHVAVPTGTNPTVVVNTTAVTANSQIFLIEDQSVGVRLGITCNTTLPTGGANVTARTAGTSFTAEITGTFTVNPVCLGYMIVN